MRRIALTAAMIGGFALAGSIGTPVRAQDQAPQGPLYRIPGASIFNWMTAPERMPDGRMRVWHWIVTHSVPGFEPPTDGYPFLTEFDCAAGTTSRIRREWWDGERLVRVIPENTPHVVWLDAFMESRLLRVVCDGAPLEGRVETVSDARRLVPRD